MNFKNYLNIKKIYFLVFFFAISILFCLTILILERKVIGISSTYHPDSSFYLTSNVYKTYSYLSFKFSFIENFLNFFFHIFSGTLYYSIVNLMHELQDIFQGILNFNPYRNLIKLNILLFSITNLIILNAVFENNRNYNFKILVSIIIFCLLPYKVHLAVNILKETFIYFFLVLCVLYSNIYTYILSFILGTSLRSLFVLYFLNFVNFKKFLSKNNLAILILFLFTFFFVITYFFSFDNFYQSFFEFLNERNLANMGGRDYDGIPNFSEKGYLGILLRSIVWPILFISGSFIFFSEHIFFKILALEIILIQFLMFYSQKKLIFSFGLILFLILLSLYVNSFTAYFRYAYLAIQIIFLKNLLRK